MQAIKPFTKSYSVYRGNNHRIAPLIPIRRELYPTMKLYYPNTPSVYEIIDENFSIINWFPAICTTYQPMNIIRKIQDNFSLQSKQI